MDDAGQRRVTNSAGAERTPIWSPDATRIAFELDRALWSIRPDGTGLTRLTNPAGNAQDRITSQKSSPDGRILYVRYPGSTGSSEEVRSVTFDGSGDRLLAPGTLGSWSSDGTLIAFNRYSTGGSEVWLMSAQGADLRNVTNTSDKHEDWPLLSPNGAMVTFMSCCATGTGLEVMRVDGTSRRLLAGGGENTLGVWSPDGARIAFRQFEDLYAINADGTQRMTLANPDGFVANVQWAPDGQRLVFDTQVSGAVTASIYIVNADGSDLRKLTPQGTRDYQPSWRP